MVQRLKTWKKKPLQGSGDPNGRRLDLFSGPSESRSETESQEIKCMQILDLCKIQPLMIAGASDKWNELPRAGSGGAADAEAGAPSGTEAAEGLTCLPKPEPANLVYFQSTHPARVCPTGWMHPRLHLIKGGALLCAFSFLVPVSLSDRYFLPRKG